MDEGNPDGVATFRATGDVAAAGHRIAANIEQVIEGKADTIRLGLTVLLAEGHLLIEDVPGVGKTKFAKALARSIDCTVRRVQFTPDLLPSDITGVSIYNTESRDFEFKPGPVFANIVVGDEINRASPKTQAALLECMEERQVTVDGVTYPVGSPFLVLATQNPIDMEGTYPLPEAQVDRFFFKLLLEFPSRAELARIADLTTAAPPSGLREIVDAGGILQMRQWVREVPLAEVVKDYAVRLVMSTHPQQKHGNGSGGLAERFVMYGSSPRGLQSLILAAKARALLAGRPNVSFDDIRTQLLPSLRHRLILNLEADAEGITAEKILTEVAAQVPEME